MADVLLLLLSMCISFFHLHEFSELSAEWWRIFFPTAKKRLFMVVEIGINYLRFRLGAVFNVCEIPR